MDDLGFFDSALSDTEMDELLKSCKEEAEQKKRKEASATEHQKKKKQKKQKKVKDTEETDAIPEQAVPSTPPTSPAKESKTPTSEEKKEVTPSSFTPKCPANGLPLHAVRRQAVQTKLQPKGLKAKYPSQCGVGACRHRIMKEPEWNKKKGVWVARCAMTWGASGNRSSYHTWYSENEGKSWEFTTTLYNLFKTPPKEQKKDSQPKIPKERATADHLAGSPEPSTPSCIVDTSHNKQPAADQKLASQAKPTGLTPEKFMQYLMKELAGSQARKIAQFCWERSNHDGVIFRQRARLIAQTVRENLDRKHEALGVRDLDGAMKFVKKVVG
ncbi:unnamed protein product [Symbiodinium sp. CCMP2456]|nr:unnamed protein product [Symbiodinium sp. CCMP2456]